MGAFVRGYAEFLLAFRYAVFVIAVVAAVIALLDWAVRTRRLNPFSAIGRFSRRVIDPLMAPIERRIVRRGGLPQNAPWWTLVLVVIGGLLLIYLLQFIGGLIVQVYSATNDRNALLVLGVQWAFGVLQIALIVRVISSWLGLSPYAPWIRWSFLLTEWMLAPLRRFIPMVGMVDITPLIAYFLLSMIAGGVVKALVR